MELEDKRSVLYNPKRISRDTIKAAEKEGRVENIAPQYPFGSSNPLYAIQEAQARSSYPDAPTVRPLPAVTTETSTPFLQMLDGAKKGDPAIQWALGKMYEEGSDGAPKDDAEASNWFLKSAKQGFKLAEYSLGRSYAYAHGVPRDYVQSVKWLSLAADQGLPEANYELAFRYLYGDGVVQNTDRALELLRKAADQGSVKAQKCLGDGLSLGLLNGQVAVAKDYAQAFKWTLQAARSGDSGAQFNLSRMYVQGEGVLQDEIEGLAWAVVASSSPVENYAVTSLYATSRDEIEKRLGTQATLLAQQRSKEIFDEIQVYGGAQRNQTYESVPSGGEVLKASGSGAIVSRNGLILTAAHLVAAPNSIKVSTTQGIRGAKVLRIDRANDIAILQLDAGVYTPLPVLSSRNVRLGQGVCTIGFPNIDIQGSSPKVTRGEISSLNGLRDDPRSWQISVPVQPGNSGGPLLDDYGNLIGIVESKLSVEAAKATNDIPQNVSYAVKSTYALSLLDPYLDIGVSGPEKTTQAPRFEDMLARAQQSVVLIFVY